MKDEKTFLRKLIKISFILYVLLLSWIIVLKFRINISDLKYIRKINLIPFRANNLKEATVNLILFVPLGMYLKYLFKDKDKKILNVLVIALTSLFYEVLQYIFHIGVSDITDIIINVIGGVIGILLINVITKIINKLKCSNLLKRILEILLIILPFIILLTLFII